MALSKKPIDPEDNSKKNNSFVSPQHSVHQEQTDASPSLPKILKPAIEPADFIPPHQATPEFKPKERKILEINEGIAFQEKDLHQPQDKKNNVPLQPQRTRITTGALSSHDILTKDYQTNYGKMEQKVLEVVQWTQKTLSDNDKNEIISRARRERGAVYEEMSTFIDNLLVKYFATSGIVMPNQQAYVIQAVINEVLGLGPLEPLWQDGRISEIMVNGPYEIRVEINGKIQYAPGCQFRDAEHLLQVCQQILGDAGRRVDVQKPLADGSLPDGSRINVVHPVVAPDGPFLTIRRFPDTVFTIEELINKKSMTEEMALVIGNLVYKGCSTLVSGATGTGKTSMLNALSGAIPLSARVITIEDTLELSLNPKKHVLKMVTKEAAANGEGGISIRALVKNALRMRPERIVIGEIRDESALDMMTAMTTGHEGSMTTVHANDAEGAVGRVASLIAQSGEYPIERALPLIASGIDIIVSIARYEDGSRRVSTIAEVLDHLNSDGELIPVILYEFVQDSTTEDGKLVGHYEKKNDVSAALTKKHRLDKKESLTLEELFEISKITKPGE